MCLPQAYTSYFDLHPTKGYSGVVTYVKDSSCRPRAAERGITGTIAQPRSIGCYPDPRDEAVWESIDAEGRACVIDCGLFVLFNLYCPNETDESRREYKMAFNAALQERAHRLLDAGRHVIILGDINVAHLPIDHCDSVGRESASDFLSAHPARAWLDSFLAPRGRFHDVTRMKHPGRKGMYTVWNTLIDARPANYGTRIDYILIDEGLIPWFKDSDVAQDVYGSDHCPVWIDLHDEITDRNGKKNHLRDVLGGGEAHAARKAPPLASCNWPELSQRGIKSFFGGSAASPAPVASGQASLQLGEPDTSRAAHNNELGLSTSTSVARNSASPINPNSPSRVDASPASPSATTSASRAKGRKSDANIFAKGRKSDTNIFAKGRSSSKLLIASNPRESKANGRDKDQGQLKLRSFFYTASGDTSEPSRVAKEPATHHIDMTKEDPPYTRLPQSSVDTSSSITRHELEQLNVSRVDTQQISSADAGLADADEGKIAEGTEVASGSQPKDAPADDAATRVSTSLAWGSIFAPPPAPLCRVHDEVCTAWTVNKSGPNHGRKFYLCSRPVGHGYERSGRDKKDVDRQYRCDFFCWANEGRAKAARASARSRVNNNAGKEPGGEATLRDVAWTAPALGSGDKRGRSFGKRSNSDSVKAEEGSPIQRSNDDVKEAHKRVKW
ncbi:Apurinic/apyrimidinic endonuclease and related enzymes [Ceraceosorus bombacis]|uniref:DNA-(apurinic or apyrimidinic site) endonuclease n=1 Tax=Ceraceosorus bombacis TaxID=401625 RepID=A0A0P1BSA9_9BASI|nr:Apurinic/apyrimidinic endonuclease and related enzymes [Ceraceosorus bombacis]